MTDGNSLEVKKLDDGTIIYTSRIKLTDEEIKLVMSLSDEERARLLERMKIDLYDALMSEYNERMYKWMMRGSIEL